MDKICVAMENGNSEAFFAISNEHELRYEKDFVYIWRKQGVWFGLHMIEEAAHRTFAYLTDTW